MQRAEAGEERIDNPEFRLSFWSVKPGGFMRLNVARKVRSACQKTGVILCASRQTGRNIRRLPQKPDFLPCANGNRPGLVRNSHGPLELAECKIYLPVLD